ncbi:FAM177 family [Popillia japonica]|uniref:FAM177 family n=1 Tax=Popillia japonica TaxID=7064 RepID=A0AAW1LAJ0_POPJA
MELSATTEAENQANIKVRVPKRVLHFSDGVLEEYSDDETDNQSPTQQQIVDPKTLTWGPWLIFKAWAAGTSTLAAIDYMGEYLAEFFGITTPKYQSEIDEYERKEAKRKELEEMQKGWTEPENTDSSVSQQPVATTV